MNKTLIILTATFPYGTGESFLEMETEILAEKFDRLIIIPVLATDDDKKKTRKINKKIEVFPLDGNVLSVAKKISGSFKTLLYHRFRSEIIWMIEKRKFNIRNLMTLLKFTVFAEDKVKQMKQLTFPVSDKEEFILYSYWFHIPAYVELASKWKFQVKKSISRGHRFDIYEYRFGEYIPYRKYLLSNIDKLYVISEDAWLYMINKYPSYKEKIAVSRLGTRDNGIASHRRKSPFHIVSCSRVVEVKRIDIIIDAMACMVHHSVKWTHIGDGPLTEKITAMAKSKIVGNNITFEFKGNMKNQEVLDFYLSENVNCFINVSSSEGVPVSIMEAMSFGIPIIATNVGGVSEIVKNNENGFLVNEDIQPEELASRISEMITCNNDKYGSYCENSRKLWEEFSNGEKNYHDFSREIMID